MVSIIIVNCNGKELLNQCLGSVLKSHYSNFEAILVDNGSTDESVGLAKEKYKKNPRFRIIINERNLGPSAGRNRGVESARGKYIAFLDHDTEVDPNWLKEAVGIMESDQTIGGAQCKLLLVDHRNMFDYAGDYLSQYGFLFQRVNFMEVDNGQFDEVVELFGAKSAGMIVRQEALMNIGGFDEDYFIYMEETDLCWRMWLNNYRVIFMPTSVVYHAFGRKAKLTSPHTKFLVKYHGTKNYITTLIKNFDTWNIIKILPIHIVLWIGIIIWHVIMGRLNEANWITKGVLYNLTHLRSIWIKRMTIQSSVRKLSDGHIMPHIMKTQPFTYFYNKLTRPSSGWRV